MRVCARVSPPFFLRNFPQVALKGFCHSTAVTQATSYGRRAVGGRFNHLLTSLCNVVRPQMSHGFLFKQGRNPLPPSTPHPVRTLWQPGNAVQTPELPGGDTAASLPVISNRYHQRNELTIRNRLTMCAQVHLLLTHSFARLPFAEATPSVTETTLTFESL